MSIQHSTMDINHLVSNYAPCHHHLYEGDDYATMWEKEKEKMLNDDLDRSTIERLVEIIESGESLHTPIILMDDSCYEDEEDKDGIAMVADGHHRVVACMITHSPIPYQIGYTEWDDSEDGDMALTCRLSRKDGQKMTEEDDDLAFRLMMSVEVDDKEWIGADVGSHYEFYSEMIMGHSQKIDHSSIDFIRRCREAARKKADPYGFMVSMHMEACASLIETDN